MDYYKALKKTIDEERKSRDYESIPTPELEKGVAAIAEELKGPMPNSERIFHCAILRGMRAELERRTSNEESTSR